VFAVILATAAAAAAVAVGAVLRKRHVSSVIGWVGLVWLVPVIGSLLYLVFGIIPGEGQQVSPHDPCQTGHPGSGPD